MLGLGPVVGLRHVSYSLGGFKACSLLCWILCFGGTPVIILRDVKSHIILCSLHNPTWKECPGDTYLGRPFQN